MLPPNRKLTIRWVAMDDSQKASDLTILTGKT